MNVSPAVVNKLIFFGVRFPARARDFSLLHSVQTGYEPKKPPIQWVAGPLSRGVKRPWREADHSPPSSIKVKNSGAIPPLPYVFMALLIN
jgi:hypothetical protein